MSVFMSMSFFSLRLCPMSEDFQGLPGISPLKRDEYHFEMSTAKKIIQKAPLIHSTLNKFNSDCKSKLRMTTIHTLKIVRPEATCHKTECTDLPM
jgi:hypothetical protein